MSQKLYQEIASFVPFDEQEAKDKEVFLKFITSFDDVLTRNNLFGHFSSSAFVVNRERSKMLVVYHNIMKGWIYPGGHADGEDDLLAVATREVTEETGQIPTVLDSEIFGIQSAPVIAHYKHGIFVPAHIHYDVIYLMEGEEEKSLSFRPDESGGVKWLPFDEAEGNDIVDWARPVHQKLIKKLGK